ncbi:hypothetical protein TTHERM_00035090 (macronuclear) [Tetrahymena thermophila SB210]|uniref:Uncharacterized protein n=1 Tax=Tetrahymena thermophila (strain SB210) TaxID=312017 RepID=Q22ML0_TETTS|nr:hypothetical protein TTHERM_00035090 [Tetrahymena thermophila SB210]EAR86323.1 hypothetical protein TTHERM_00035090 [Tetrahymena thermophila SB210]|eukprot:XP_977010.1 hypothetical protein TTHERM_00035090 [Tetrahymena thermophila SB210]
MIDYLKDNQKDILVYAVQQTFQKNYEHLQGDVFNTYFCLTNFSQQKEQLNKQKLDQVIVLNPYFFDTQLSQQINLVECVKLLVQNYFTDSQNRLAILSLTSSDQEIQDCFQQQPVDQIKNIQLQQDIEFTSFKHPQNVISQIKNIILKTQQFQRDDAILSLTFISPDNFDYSKQSKQELKKIIKEQLGKSDQISENNRKVILNCMTIGQQDNFLLQQMCEIMPQSIYQFCDNKDFIEKFKDTILSVQSIFMTDIETTLTFKSDSNLIDYSVVEFPKNWINLNEYTYKFSYPFLYKFQELNHLFKLRIQFKGSLSKESIQETIGFNRSSFTYNNQKYFYERAITIDLVQQTQELSNDQNQLNTKCQIAFLKEKYVIPFLQSYIEKFKENKEEVIEMLSICLEKINQLDVKQSFVHLYSKQVLQIINKFIEKNECEEKEKKKVDSFVNEALFVLQNQLQPIKIYLKIKEQLQ